VERKCRKIAGKRSTNWDFNGKNWKKIWVSTFHSWKYGEVILKWKNMGYPQKCDNLDVLISTTGKPRDLTHKFCENPDLICSSQSLEKGHFWVDSSIPTDVSEPRSGGRGILKQHVFGKFGNGHKYVEICGNVHIHIH
jgi:hypothetical protein